MQVVDDPLIPASSSRVRTAALHCPRCVWPYLHPVGTFDQPRLQCESCRQCWRLERGALRPLVPSLR